MSPVAGGDSRRPAVFLDRDGTLIEDRGHLSHPDDVVFFPQTVAALRRLQQRFLLFIVTNQSGVALGKVQTEDVERVNRHVQQQLEEQGVRIAAVYVCPHQRSDGCCCIKPNPYFLRRAEEQHQVDLERSFTVGDHPHDVAFARTVGARGIYVRTGHGQKHLDELPGSEIVVADIAEAADWILAGDESNDFQTAHAAAALRAGGVVAFPTETVYGLGADVFQPQAVARVFEIKGRPRFDPLIAHIARRSQLESLAAEVPDAARALIDRFWPGPLTVVLPKRSEVPDLVTAGLATVAVRMPAHPLALRLIDEAATPIAAPSANLFGCISPTTAEHVREQLGGSIDGLLDGGPCPFGIESTIVGFDADRPRVLRLGAVPVEQIESVIGPVEVLQGEAAVPLAPGGLPRHYAPRTPLALVEALPLQPPPGRVGLLSLRKPPDATGFVAMEVLSPTGDLREAAANLFAAMRRLDALRLDLILAICVPEVGLGRAIMDRLRRARH